MMEMTEMTGMTELGLKPTENGSREARTLARPSPKLAIWLPGAKSEAQDHT